MDRVVRSTTTKEKILDAAAELISENGVTSTSLANICKKINISKGTLYYYYKTKEEIIFDIADIQLTKITDDIMSWLDNMKEDLSIEEILTRIFEKVLSAETRGKSYIYLISDAVTKSETFREKFKKKYQNSINIFEEGLKKELKNKNVDYEILSQILVSMLDGFILQHLVGVENIPFENIFKFLFKQK